MSIEATGRSFKGLGSWPKTDFTLWNGFRFIKFGSVTRLMEIEQLMKNYLLIHQQPRHFNLDMCYICNKYNNKCVKYVICNKYVINMLNM